MYFSMWIYFMICSLCNIWACLCQGQGLNNHEPFLIFDKARSEEGHIIPKIDPYFIFNIFFWISHEIKLHIQECPEAKHHLFHNTNPPN